MKIQKSANPLEDRMSDFRAAELERTKALLEYVAIMADVEIPVEETDQHEEGEDEQL